MGTKKEMLKRKEAWHRAIIDGRVLRLNHGQTMKEYTNRGAADKALADCRKTGVPCERVHGVHA
jgi:hypothetical protein